MGIRRNVFTRSVALLALAMAGLGTPVSVWGFGSESQPYIARLSAVGKLWAFVRYLHPYLAYRDIDWDAALVGAIARIELHATRRDRREFHRP